MVNIFGLESKNWILAEKPNDAITIIDRELLAKGTEKRKDEEKSIRRVRKMRMRL